MHIATLNEEQSFIWLNNKKICNVKSIYYIVSEKEQRFYQLAVGIELKKGHRFLENINKKDVVVVTGVDKFTNKICCFEIKRDIVKTDYILGGFEFSDELLLDLNMDDLGAEYIKITREN